MWSLFTGPTPLLIGEQYRKTEHMHSYFGVRPCPDQEPKLYFDYLEFGNTLLQ